MLDAEISPRPIPKEMPLLRIPKAMAEMTIARVIRVQTIPAIWSLGRVVCLVLTFLGRTHLVGTGGGGAGEEEYFTFGSRRGMPGSQSFGLFFLTWGVISSTL